MLALTQLSRIRQHRDLNWARLAKTTGLDWRRLKDLESVDRHNQAEPWFDEALIIARALCTAGIYPLITAGRVKDVDFGKPLPGAIDIDLFRSGMRLRLAVACRVTRAFGLADPVELVQPRPETLRQIWSIVASGERLGALGGQAGCPWCMAPVAAGADHLPTCLPNNICGARGRAVAPHIRATVPPEQRGIGKRASSEAWGLRAIRAGLGFTQTAMAARVGYSSGNHYARIERGEIRLPLDRADIIANILGVEVPDLFKRGLDNPPSTHDDVEDGAAGP